MLAVRKKRTGETKESKAKEGCVKSRFFRRWSMAESHFSLMSSSSWETAVSRLEGDASFVEAIPAQSKMAFLVSKPAIRVGRALEVKDSVRAREAARDPPRLAP